MLLSQLVPPSPTPNCVHKSALYVCISIAALQVGSSVPSFKIPYKCINIWHLFSSFWLTSFCIIDSRSIYLIRSDSNAFILYGWVIFHSSILSWKIPWTEEATVCGVTKSQTWLSNFTFTFNIHTHTHTHIHTHTHTPQFLYPFIC